MTAALEEALYQAIHEQPRDDTPWLVLADWLEEQSDARAELVRLQLQLRRELPTAHRSALEQGVRQLLARGVAPCVPEVVNSLGMRLALIRPGFFWMGSLPGEEDRYGDEEPRHRVELTRPFYMGIHAVTQHQYRRVMGQSPSWFSNQSSGADAVLGLDTNNFPVENISWYEAMEFCRCLSELPEEKQAGRVYRLPTEAEWEYACRAGCSSLAPFHFGHTLSSLQANFDGTRPYGNAPQGPNLRRPCSVGSYPPNAWGLYDMHGNVWEWCADWFDVDYYPESPPQDPPGPTSGERRILRGGSFYYIASSCRSAIRFGRSPEAHSNLDGFRIVLNWSSQAGPTGVPLWHSQGR